ncbi:hypothetical protein EVAR_20091_1 [Eumeta japonica]|uniref:Uncharacterized protein n=1 Tax=Eumeta variegata TaxID=151549 RepID=A0A4C1V4I3_EUMVA|nr:hypothetical protein EVAR_20091_1 [Eumeta japonica]
MIFSRYNINDNVRFPALSDNSDRTTSTSPQLEVPASSRPSRAIGSARSKKRRKTAAVRCPRRPRPAESIAAPRESPPNSPSSKQYNSSRLMLKKEMQCQVNSHGIKQPMIYYTTKEKNDNGVVWIATLVRKKI